MPLFVALVFLQGADVILARLQILEQELTILEFGAFDPSHPQHGHFDLDMKHVQICPLCSLPMNV
jgi:hypothetical protein